MNDRMTAMEVELKRLKRAIILGLIFILPFIVELVVKWI